MSLRKSFRERYLDVLASIYIYNEHRGYTSLDRVLEAVRARCPDDRAFQAEIEKHRADEEKHYRMFRRWFERQGKMPLRVDRGAGHIDRFIQWVFHCSIDELDTGQIVASAVRATDVQNQRGPRCGISSSRSPTVAAAKSRGVTSDRTVSARRALRMGHSREHDAAQQPPIRPLRSRHGLDTSLRDLDVTLRPSAALRRGIAEARGDQPLLLEPIEGGVERTGCRLALGAGENLGADARPVRLVLQAEDREEHDLFELTELRGGCH